MPSITGHLYCPQIFQPLKAVGSNCMLGVVVSLQLERNRLEATDSKAVSHNNLSPIHRIGYKCLIGGGSTTGTTMIPRMAVPSAERCALLPNQTLWNCQRVAVRIFNHRFIQTGALENPILMNSRVPAVGPPLIRL